MHKKRALLGLSAVFFLPVVAFSDWRSTHESVLRAVRELRPPVGAYELSLDTTSSGGLTLEGWVSSRADRGRIEAVARSVAANRVVTNEIAVDPNRSGAPSTGSADAARAEVLTAAISRELLGSAHKISVVVQGPRVVLRGTVESEAARLKANAVARRLEKGSVSDEMQVFAPRPDSEIAEAVEDELRRQYPALARKVSLLETKAGVVTLAGDLKDHVEVDLVLSVTMMVEGVRDVTSEITVQGQPYSSQEGSSQASLLPSSPTSIPERRESVPQ